LGNPLCRGVDEICTELLGARDGSVAQLLEHLKHLKRKCTENLELKTKEFGLKTEINRLKKENDRLDCLLDCYMEERSGVMAVCQQQNSVLMHYNELQLRSAEVEAMIMNFEQRVAGAVAKAGLTPSLLGLFWGLPGGGRGVCGGVRSANQLKVTR
jgi:hypothetical protein